VRSIHINLKHEVTRIRILRRARQRELDRYIISLYTDKLRRQAYGAVRIWTSTFCEAIAVVGRIVDVVELEVYRSLEADAWDVRPVEEGVGCDREAEEYQAGKYDEEGGQVCAKGGLGEDDAEGSEGEVLHTYTLAEELFRFAVSSP